MNSKYILYFFTFSIVSCSYVKPFKRINYYEKAIGLEKELEFEKAIRAYDLDAKHYGEDLRQHIGRYRLNRELGKSELAKSDLLNYLTLAQRKYYQTLDPKYLVNIAYGLALIGDESRALNLGAYIKRDYPHLSEKIDIFLVPWIENGKDIGIPGSK